MKRTFLLVLVILSIALFAERVSLNEGSKLFEHTTLSADHTQINFTLDGYEIEEITKGTTAYKRINYSGEGEFAIPGKPDLPNFTRLFAIPDRGDVRLQINNFEEEIISDIVVYPRQELKIDQQDLSPNFTVNSDYYESGKVFPAQIAEIGEPAVLRDYRVVTVSVNPFQYDPVKRELRIIKNIDLDLICEGQGGINLKTTNQKSSRFFKSMYESLIENYETLSNRDEDFQQPNYLFIHKDNNSVETYLEYLTDWKRRKGFEVVTASTAETGTTSTSIKNYIQDAYDTWENPPEFICIVGDTGGSFGVAAVMSGWTGSDHPYTQLAGNDILADAFIGRLSFETITEFQTILNKIFQYEKTPHMDETDWFNEVLLVGDPSSSGPSTQSCNKSIKESIISYNDDFIFHEQYSGGFANFIDTNINNGVGYFNYRGYIGMSGWSPGGYSNGPMMPNAVIITCSTGSFADGTSRSESFLREGTPTVPKGAVTAIGTATSSTHTMFNNCVSMGIFHGIFRENIFNMGGALVHGKLNLYNTYSTNSPNQTANFSNWNNLMGDPGMEVWTGIPEYLIVTNASEVVQGTNFIDVSVTNSSAAPVADAWVTVLGQTDDAVFATGYTDQNGNISLPLDTNYSGDYYLTVTAHDFVPYLMDIESVNADVFVNVSDFAIDDDTSGDSSGNDDGLLNPSEQIELSILLGNYGTNTATGVSATISCEQDFIDISDNTENYGDISAGNTESSSDDFDISVNEDVLGGTEFVLDITISSSNRTTWTDHLELTVDGANLMPDSYTVEDGNNDFPEPGETFELISELINAGSVAAENINGTLTCLEDDVTISDANGYFGNIAASGTGTNSGNTFEITTDATIIPGTLIPFEINLTNDSGYSNTVTFNVQIGEANISDPLGPDAYGYYIYDDEDTNYYNTPVYNWIEIDPDYGGPGTTLPLYDNGDTGDIDVIDLPFGFRMYGEQYSEITVCSNGWIAPGVTEDFSFMNWNIPGPGGPSPMIAVFWDDLKTSGGNVCYYNDTAMHKFIIEWSHMQSDYANDEETFQVILYDPNYYPTATGDSEILFQYKEINNTSQGNTDNYPMDHGQYCTIGLEDPTGIIGLEYTFNNMYPVQAKHLEDEMAILITGPPISFIQPYPVLGSLTIDDALNGNGNGNPDFGEGIFLGIGLNNLGETTATGLSGVISSTDEYITILNHVSDYPDIESGTSEQNITLFEIEIAADCPDEHVASFTINLTGEEDEWEWELYFQLQLNAPSIFINGIFIADDDNNILDPGETTDIQISFLNEGSAAVYNSGVELISDDANIILNSTTIDFGTFDEESVILGTFNVSVSEDAPLGYISNVTALLTGDFDYTSSHQFNLNVGTIAEDFETGGFENLPWEQSGSADWYIDDNAYEGNYCAKSGTITHNQVSQISIEMDVFTDGTIVFYRKVSSESNDYLRFFIDGALQGQWSGNVDWSEVSFPVTEGTRTFRWQYLKDGYGDSGQDCAWIDSIVFPPGIGFIAGMVLLSDGDGNVEDTVVTAGQYTTNPNESGEYLLQVPEGNYELTAVLANYEPITFYNVIVIANQTTSRFIPLAFMTPPTNLSANIVNDNDVELEWDYPTLRETAADHEDGVSKNTERNSSSRTSNRDSRSVTGFKIYRDEAEIAELEGTEITSYTDIELEEGEYEYFVTAVYTAGESEPTESVSIEVDANDSAGDLIPPFTALKGNFPNPFNPNTSIKFQLADAGDIELEIYNVKGQKVKTLFTGNMKAGYHIIDWNGKDNFGYSVSSGIYFYEMKTDNYSDIKKMIMLK